MKNAVRALAVVLMLVSIVSVVGCSSSSEKSSFVSMMKMLPEDLGELTFIDVQTLQTDDSLVSTWDLIQNQLIGPDIYGENSSKITGLGLVGSNKSMMLYKGNFDFNKMTLVIEQNSVESFDYKGVTIWTDQNASSAAVIDDVVFIGSSEDIQLCIDVANGKANSLYENKDIRDVVGRLPIGYEMGAGIMDNSSQGAYGLLVIGDATVREGNNSVNTQVGKFKDSAVAEQFMTSVQSQISSGMKVVQDGQFITMTLTSELPGPNESAYNTVYTEIQNAVTAYASEYNGVLPAINGTVNISGYDFQIVDICPLLTSEGGMLIEVPEGVASINGSDDDNCDAGCDGCLDTNHYIWAIDDSGYIYSTCVGANCSAYNADGYQGVWP